MPAPTAYTENTLRSFVVERLSDVATILGWTGASSQITRAIYATQRSYSTDIADVAEATDMAKLEALAEREAWRAAVNALAARVNLSGAGTSASMAQAYDHAKEMLAIAEADCMVIGAGQSVFSVHRVTYSDDPYQVQTADVTGF